MTPRCSDYVNYNGTGPTFATSDPSVHPSTVLEGNIESNQHEGKVMVHNVATYVEESNGAEDMGILHNCGLLPNNCLPCLAGTASSSDEKRKSLSSSPKKKAALRLSFKWRDGQAAPTICKFCYCIEIHISVHLCKFCFLYYNVFSY